MQHEALKSAWYQFCKACVPNTCTVTHANQPDDAPRPKKPYLILNFIGGPRPRTLKDELRKDEDEEFFSLVGEREYTLSIQAYGDECQDYLNKIQTSLDDPDKAELLKVADISTVGKGRIIDLTRPLPTGWESRASLDIVFSSSNNQLTGIGTIEKAVISGVVETESGVQHEIQEFQIIKE